MIFKAIILGAVLAAVLAFGLGIIIGHFAIKKASSSNSAPTTWKYDRLTRPADRQHYTTFISAIQASRIEENLKDLTSRPHMAGGPEDYDSAEVIAQRWIQDGLQVTKPKYNVLLSYPNDTNPNRVVLTFGNGTVIVRTNATERVYDSNQTKTVDLFLAYTPAGNASSRRLYYGNYGRLDDLKKLASEVGNASLQGSIIIMRYGRVFRGDKVMHAQQFGAVGAILYNDPADYAPFGISSDQVYDKKWYMPPTGAQRGSAFTGNGDPLTPVYPSTNYTQRKMESSLSSLPRIPAQPIGYGEAQVILQYLQGNTVTSEWSGALPNVNYRYGGQLPDLATIRVESFNRQENTDTYNVIGIMKGEIEPDRYVAIGNHRDAWSLGAVDPTSGTATLLEITRVLGDMYRNGFRPRRSLMFCSWGAEEYGLVGSVEYVEEYVKVLGARLVSYLNLDIAVEGNYTVYAKASPLLFDVIVEAATMVPSAYDYPEQTIYQKWMKVRRNNITNEPIIGYNLGSGSDFFAFDQLTGSANFDATYWFNSADHGNLGSYPLYHTSYEVFSLVKKFIDPDFYAHRAIGQFTGVLSLLLSETPVLPFNVTRYTVALRRAVDSLLLKDPVALGQLRAAVNDFDSAVQDFVTRAKTMDAENPYVIRAYNDQLLQLERAFLNPLGQGADQSEMKHILYAPSATPNDFAPAGFPTIGDAIATNNTEEITKQVGIVVYFIRGALSTLKDFNQFIAT